MKALIAMSGGVDSSLAAKILCDKGYECIGCVMFSILQMFSVIQSSKNLQTVTKEVSHLILALIATYSLTQTQLAHTLFPLGNMKKTEVRAVAEKAGFVNATKPDSQDICFTPNGDYASAIELQTGRKSLAGNFIDKDGYILCKHKGVIHYTIT